LEKKLKENILLEDVLTKLLEKNEELYKFEKMLEETEKPNLLSAVQINSLESIE